MKSPEAQLEQNAALAAIRDLLEAHFAEAEDSADEEGRFSVSFRVQFDRSANPARIKVVSRISKTFTDEIETDAAELNQPKLF